MISIAELARSLGAEAAGNLELGISGAAEPAAASRDQIALAMSPAFAEGLRAGAARAAILWQGADWQSFGLEAAIFAPRPRYLLAGVTHAFERPAWIEDGIHPTAILHPTAEIGPNARIGPFVTIGPGARIGANARLHPHVSIAEDVEIGPDALIHAGARIGARVRIGARFIAQPGAVVGADGLSYVTPSPGHVEEARAAGVITAKAQESFVRIHSLGAVVLGDDVEIGANACIDRGTIANTTIGDGTKIDNLVQIGHNVRVGHTCLVCGQAGIAGSSVIGDRVVIGGGAKIADHLRIGSNVVITGNSGVASHVADNQIMMGYPAVRMDQNVEMYKALRRLPRLVARLTGSQKLVSNPAGTE